MTLDYNLSGVIMEFNLSNKHCFVLYWKNIRVD